MIKKLPLQRETIRHLSLAQLPHARGGWDVPPQTSKDFTSCVSDNPVCRASNTSTVCAVE
jgi:hypothetical protein